MSFVRQSANPIFVLGFFSEKYESHICLGVFRKCANPILFMSFFSAKCESHFFRIFRKSANRIFVYEFFGNVRIPYSDLGSARLCSFAVNWESDLQCRRGPNAVQNTLKPTSHSYPRIRQRVGRHHVCRALISQLQRCMSLYMDRLKIAFVCPLRIKLTITHLALDFLQLTVPNIS